MREAFARCPAVRPYVRSVSRAARPGRRRKGEGKNAEEEKDRPRAGPRAGAVERDGVCRQQAGSVPVYGESERSHRAPGRGGSAGVHRSGQRGKRAGNAARGRSSVRWTGRDGAGAPRTQGPGAIRAAQLFLDAPEEEYLVEYMPAEVPEGVYPYANGTMEIRNGPDERALYVDGEPVELPTDRETADAAGLPVYLDGDAMYFTHQESEQITRLDGKQMIFFEAVMAPASEGAEGLSNGMSGNAEAQPDGSVLLWFDAFSDAPLPETVEMKLNVSAFLDGEPFPLEDIAFSLDRAEPERTAAFAPEGDGAIGERVRIRAVNMTVTKVRGYLTIDYEYQAAEEEPMGISFRLYDGEGNEIHTGSGGGMFDAETGIYREQQEMQSFDEIPTSLILEAKAIGGEVLGRCTVALQE